MCGEKKTTEPMGLWHNIKRWNTYLITGVSQRNKRMDQKEKRNGRNSDRKPPKFDERYTFTDLSSLVNSAQDELHTSQSSRWKSEIKRKSY